MADLPGMYSNEHREAHNPHATQRVEHAAGAAGAAGGVHGAQGPSAMIHFFFMESENSSGLESFMKHMSNMDVLMYQETRNGGKFWWRLDNGEYDCTYITGIKITGTYGGGTTLQVQITTCHGHTDFEETRQGYMTDKQYKKLAVFIIAQSGSTDLLGDPIGDHIRFRMHNRHY